MINDSESKHYLSKLLLFGEYSVINGSQALAMPFDRYYGSWEKGPQEDPDLLAFAGYLEKLPSNDPFLDTEAFRQELEEGLFFRSNIPIGYGLGSSGALCAAVYDRYARHPIAPQEPGRLETLRKQLALMESHFHGSSSGADPLICYLNYPVVIHPEKGIQKVDLPEMAGVPFWLFLLNTQISRSTGPLVERFLEKCRAPDYAAQIDGFLKPLVDQAIADFLAARWERVGEAIKMISQFQLAHFSEMIPSGLKPLWEEGLTTGDFALKLCGAGGGGFLMGMAKDETVLKYLNRNYPSQKLW